MRLDHRDVLSAPAETSEQALKPKLDAQRQPQQICMVSSNAPNDHPGSNNNFQELFDGCLASTPGTQIVVLSLQDYKNDIYPESVEVVVNAVYKGPRDDNVGFNVASKKRFILQHKRMLPGEYGHRKLCRKDHGAIANAFVWMFNLYQCGGVAVLVYATESAPVVETSWTRTKEPHASSTTRKGTVALMLDINGRSIVVASTHAAEGVRGKKRGAPCPGEDDGEAESAEMQRTHDFLDGMEMIQQLMQKGTNFLEVGMLWAGDFNPRTQDPKTACPIWPRLLPVTEPLPRDIDQSIEMLNPGRDTLGADPQQPWKTTSFSTELDSRMQEIPGLKCPTYKKMPKPSKALAVAVQCSERNGEVLYYLEKRPASWTDRIFGTKPDAVPWLRCGDTQRVVHQNDHDAVYVTCDVSAPDV